jgi:hypothetical protein
VAIGVNVSLGVVLYHYHDLADLTGLQLTRKTDPYSRILGWRELGEDVGKIMAQYPDAHLLGDNRNALAELIYYIRPHPFDAAMWNPDAKTTDHYSLNADLKDHPGSRFVFVTRQHRDDQLSAHFQVARRIGRVTIPVYPELSRDYHVYYVEGFKGY